MQTFQSSPAIHFAGRARNAPLIKEFTALCVLIVWLGGHKTPRISNPFLVYLCFVATENLPFQKYPCICELEGRHGVSIGTTYTNKIACKTFCHYIAQSKRSALMQAFSDNGAKFYSLLLDGSMDKGNIDDLMFLFVWCDINGDKGQMIHELFNHFKGLVM